VFFCVLTLFFAIVKFEFIGDASCRGVIIEFKSN